MRDLAREQRRAAKQAQQALEEALASLPAPQFEYELAIPSEMEEDQDMRLETIKDEPDMADVEAEARDRQREKADLLYQARSTVLKRHDLPRPSGRIPDRIMTIDLDGASALVHQELIKLLRHYDKVFPVVELDRKKKSKKRKKDTPSSPCAELDALSEEGLDRAREILQQETEVLQQEIIDRALQSNGGYTTRNAVMSAMTKAATDSSREGASSCFYSDCADGFVEAGNELEALKLEFQTIREATMTLRKKNDKVAVKLGVKNGGYNLRAKALQEEMLQNFAIQQNHKIEREVFENLASLETRGAARRIDALQDELAALERQEALLQKKYGELLLERKRTLASVVATT